MKNIIKKATRRKINRSGNECCVICGNRSILVEHHISGRDIPDANKWWNLAGVCSNCHMLIHSNKIIISEWVSTTNGRELLWHYKNEESLTGKDATPYIIPNIKNK